MVTTEIQIRFADTDMLGHINNVNLQHYFDLGKSDYLHSILDLKFPMSEVGFIVKSTLNVYNAQIYYGDNIVVQTHLDHIGNTSITMKQEVVKIADNQIAATSESVMVCYDFNMKAKCCVPDNWRNLLRSAEKL